MIMIVLFTMRQFSTFHENPQSYPVEKNIRYSEVDANEKNNNCFFKYVHDVFPVFS